MDCTIVSSVSPAASPTPYLGNTLLGHCYLHALCLDFLVGAEGIKVAPLFLGMLIRV